MSFSDKDVSPRDTLPACFYDIDLLPNCPAILTVKEAAAVCSVSVQTLTRMIASGTLPVIPETGDILRADLIDYITHNTLADKPVL